MLEITAQDIADLADDDLRSLVGRLCEAQLRSLGLPTSAVTWGGNQDAPDDGIDVRVALPAATTIQGFVPRPATVFQVKKPDMPRRNIFAEMRPSDIIRPVIQELADQSGAYIIVSSSGSTSDLALRNRRRAMADAVSDVRHADSLALDFYDRTRIATWLREYPGLIPWVRERIGKAIQGWHSYGAWAYPPEGVQSEYLIDEGARIHTAKKEDGEGLSAPDGIKRMRGLLRSSGTSVRLVGLSGVGKTSLVQALFDDRIDGECLDPSLALYTNMADDPNPQPVGLASDLLAARTRVILVVDNCPSDLHRRLSDVCRAQGSTISVVTVEYDIREDAPEGTEVLELRPSSVALVEKLIKTRFQEVSPLDAHAVAEFSGGNARVAIALASTIGKGDTIAGLRDEDLFNRLFQQRHEHDNSLLIAAQAFSLVYSFQGEEITGPDAELPRLGAMVEQSAQEAFRHVAVLHRRDLVQQRGVWRAVLPHAIANRLAAMALQNIPFQVVEAQLVNGTPGRLLKSFSRRLGYLHASQEALGIVENWLAAGGLLGDIAQQNDLERSMFCNVAPVAPSAALAAIERAFNGNFDDKIISRLKDYVHLLRSLAYEPSLFNQSIALLITLANVEDDSDQYSSAENAFESLFQLYLSGTHAPIEQRLPIIEELIKSNDPRRRELGIKALDAALEAWHFSSSYSFEFGGRSRDFGFSPRTNAEVQHWFSTVLELVESLACFDQPVAEQVCTTLAQNFRGLWTKAGMYDDLERILPIISGKGNGCNLWTSVQETMNFDLKNFPQEVRSRLSSLEQILRPKDLLHKVRYIVLSGMMGRLDLSALQDDIPDSADTNIKREEAVVEMLGKRTAEDSQTFNELLPELVTSKGRLFLFGRGLATGTRNPEVTWNALVAQFGMTAEEKRNIQVLRGFLNALRERDASLSDRLLDEIFQNEVLVKCLPILHTAVPIDARGMARLYRSLAGDKTPIWKFTNLAYGRFLDTVSGTDFKKLILTIAAKHNGYDPALEILSMRLHSDNQDKRSRDPEVAETGRQLLAQLDLQGRRHQNSYELGEVVKVCLTGVDGACIVRNIFRKLKYSISKHEVYASDNHFLVQSVIEAQPLPSLDALFADKDTERQQGVQIIEDISRSHANPLDSMKENDLLDWCDQDPAVRYPTIAAVISIFHRPDEKAPLQWTSLAGRVLDKAPDRIAVLEEFVKRFRPMSWSGSRAAIIEGRTQLLQQLEGYNDPLVVEFVATAQTRLKEMIKQERERESEYDRATDERFE